MDKQAILSRLASGKPLFEKVPWIARKFIMGTESEFGTIALDEKTLPSVLFNGGEVYVDCTHIEYASPETSNPLSAVIYYEAGKEWCVKRKYGSSLFCNNNDVQTGTTFGAHENYYTKAPPVDWLHLVPFLVARTLLSGTGWVNKEGAFEVSQRASWMQTVIGWETTANRAIINTREEPLGAVPCHKRLHLICGDAGMSEMTTFLRLGTTSLMLEMLEMKVLPKIPYNVAGAVKDIRALSKQNSLWELQGTEKPTTATELLRAYLQKAQALFSGRDDVTDALLVVWEDTLDRLEKNPDSLWQRLDWVAKRYLLDMLYEADVEGDRDLVRYQSEDMHYHSLDVTTGLYYGLRPFMERLVSDELISEAMTEPPSDTRAYARGKIATELARQGGTRALCNNGWEVLAVVNRADRGAGRTGWGISTVYWSQKTPDPYNPYPGAVRNFNARA